jgi:glycosyltransferase involved in cell wall biosynthesis
LINQALKEIVIICVDDGSTDQSLEILKEFSAKDNCIKVVQQDNMFAGVARNTGIQIKA